MQTESRTITTTFKYSYIPNFNILIDEYIKTRLGYNLYTYIKKFIEYCNTIEQKWVFNKEHCGEAIYNLVSIIINSNRTDLWFLDKYIASLEMCLYDFELDNGTLNYTPNPCFMEWCDRFDTILTRNSKKEKSIRNVIVPFQKSFLERVWNPHTKIGRCYGEMKRDELEWYM